MRASSSLDLRRYFFNFPTTSGEGDKDDGRLLEKRTSVTLFVQISTNN